MLAHGPLVHGKLLKFEFASTLIVVRTTAQRALESKWATHGCFNRYSRNLGLTLCIFCYLPDFAVDLQIEENKGDEGHDARHDDVVPPSREFHVLLVLEDLRHFVVDGAVVLAADQVVLEEAGEVLFTDFSFHSA